MRQPDCVQEQDLLDALRAGRWPDRCGEELRAHVETCAICSDVIEVALPLLDEREVASALARVPKSGLVWWRAQRRSREEALRAAAQPITLVQAVALACAVGGVLALLGAMSTWLQAWAGWLGGVVRAIGAGAIEFPGGAAFVQLGLSAWLILAPVAIYLAVTDD